MRLVFWGGLIFAVLIATSLATPAFTQEEGADPCSLVKFDPHCSPSGWMSFLVGDILITFLLAVVVYEIGRRNSNKVSEATKKIEGILEEEGELRKRQVIFIDRAIKDAFGVIMMSAGLINMKLKVVKEGDDVESQIQPQVEVMKRAIRNAHGVAEMAVEVLDPELVGEIYLLLDHLHAIKPEAGAGSGFPEYGEISDSINAYVIRLDAEVENAGFTWENTRNRFVRRVDQ